MEDPRILKIPKTKKYIAFSSCHRIPERSFFWKGKAFLCYRCLGIDLGFILSALVLFLSLFIPKIDPIDLLEGSLPFQLRYYFLVAILLQVPFILDGLMQAFTSYTSTNPIRFITGLLGGIGQFYLLISIGALIGSIISLI
jgi:uncharacterized membrane protein